MLSDPTMWISQKNTEKRKKEKTRKKKRDK